MAMVTMIIFFAKSDCGCCHYNRRYDDDYIPFIQNVDNLRDVIYMPHHLRDKYPDSCPADLYDDVLMPPELRKAHQENDKAVMRAYGFSIKDTTEASCVAALMKMYQEKVAEK